MGPQLPTERLRFEPGYVTVTIYNFAVFCFALTHTRARPKGAQRAGTLARGIGWVNLTSEVGIGTVHESKHTPYQTP